MVPVIHIIVHGGIIEALEPQTVKLDLAYLIEILCIGTVDCYGLISGYVGYGKKTRYANLALLWLKTLFYSVIITAILFIAMPGKITPMMLASSFIPVITEKYWYFTAYFGMFLFTPIVNKALEVLTKKEAKTISIMFIVFFSAVPSLFFNTALFGVKEGFSLIWLLVMYFIGGTLKKCNICGKKKKASYLIAYFGFSLLALMSKAVIAFVTIRIFGVAKYENYLVSYISPLIVLAVIGLLLFFANLQIKKNSVFERFIAFFAPLCFSVYLIHEHPLFREYFIKDKFVFLAKCNPFIMIVGIIGLGVGIFLACSLIDVIRDLLFKWLKLKQRLNSIEQKADAYFEKKLDK